MESRTQRDDGDVTASSDAMMTARESLALWLRSGRAHKKLSVEDVAKITKIQPRILEKLERGELDGLPADVFVKGFVRSFAKCVGLDEQEALVRYGACKSPDAAATPTAKALVESMGLARKPQGTPVKPTPVVAAPIEQSAVAPVVDAPVIAAEPVELAPIELAPIVEATPVVESAPLVEVAPVVEAPLHLAVEPTSSEQPKKKRSRKKNPTNGAPRSRKKKGAPAVEAPSTNEIAPPSHGIGLATNVVDDDAHTTQIVMVSLDTGPVAMIDGESLMTSAIEAKTDDAIIANPPTIVTASDDASDGSIEIPRFAEGSERISSSQIEVVDVSGIELDVDVASVDATASAGSWQPTMPPIASTPSVPWRRPHITASRTYVMPTLVIDDADPDSADREREDRAEKDQSRLSFLPPILLDREDRTSRQGGLTLAVIILLIAATLTLSYLMRRPSASGDGVTLNDAPDTHSQLLS